MDKLLTQYGWYAAGTRDTDSKPIEPISYSTLQQMFVDCELSPLDGTLEHGA